MAVVCARCGNQNAEGMAFCTKCGAPLAAAATPPAAGAGQPPVPQGPAATPPVVPPSAPAAPVTGGPIGPASGGPPLPPPLTGAPPPSTAHRLSRNALIAIIVVAVLLVGGAAVVFALVNKGPNTPKPPSPTGLPTNLPSSPATLPPSQSPRPTSPPTNPPSAQPSPGPGGGGGKTVQTSFGTIFVPDGFSDQGSNSQGNCTTDTLSGPNNGLLIYGSCQLPSGTTQSAFDNVVLAGDQQALDPNAKLCEPIKTGATLSGTSGTIPADGVPICLDVTPQSGPAFHAIDFYFTAVAHASDGSTVGLTINFFAPADQYNTFVKALPDGVFSQTVFNASP